MKTPLILCLALLSILVSAQDKPVFKAGAATSNITPPLGMEIVGNFAPCPIAKRGPKRRPARAPGGQDLLKVLVNERTAER